MHHRPQNLGKKKAEMQKKNAKMQKKKQKCKKSRKCTFDSKIRAKKAEMQKKGKNGKMKAHLFGFFRFYIPCAFFCILNLKIHIKKDKNAKKKAKKCFQIAKKHMQKKAENNTSISKKMQKSRNAKKKCKKKSGGVY